MEIYLTVLTSGASGVEDSFAKTWDEKNSCRREEQLESCRLFGLNEGKIDFLQLIEDEKGACNSFCVTAVIDQTFPHTQ